MHEFFPLLTVFGVIGAISVVLIVAYASIKDRKEAIGFDRHRKAAEILAVFWRMPSRTNGAFCSSSSSCSSQF